jgi:hypothetical protein
MDFRDLNHACPKDNFRTPFIDQIIDDCVGQEAISFMDGFSSYNQIQIHPADQSVQNRIHYPLGYFCISCHAFWLKEFWHVFSTFQWGNFENDIFVELSSRLGFSHAFASPYYPQSNRQVKAVNKVLKTMLQCMVNKHKTNWYHMLFSVLWAYRTAVKTTTGFTPFHLVHGVEATLPIE